MKSDLSIARDIRSIRNALWMIVAILLIQFAFNLPELRREKSAEMLMLLGLFGGIIIFITLFVKWVIGLLLGSADTPPTEEDVSKLE